MAAVVGRHCTRTVRPVAHKERQLGPWLTGSVRLAKRSKRLHSDFRQRYIIFAARHRGQLGGTCPLVSGHWCHGSRQQRQRPSLHTSSCATCLLALSPVRAAPFASWSRIQHCFSLSSSLFCSFWLGASRASRWRTISTGSRSWSILMVLMELW